MLNHVRSYIKINKLNCGEDTIQHIVNKLTSKEKTSGARCIDFDLIIPEPRLKQDCDKKYIATPKSHIKEDIERPWFNWYEWHCDKWGTKWNAYDGYVLFGKTWITFVFSTAYSFPTPIIKQIINILSIQMGIKGFEINIKYADKDLGNNCGEMHYSEQTGEWDGWTGSSGILSPDKDTRYKFARNLWTRY